MTTPAAVGGRIGTSTILVAIATLSLLVGCGANPASQPEATLSAPSPAVTQPTTSPAQSAAPAPSASVTATEPSPSEERSSTNSRPSLEAPINESPPAGQQTDVGEVIYVVDGDTLDVRGAGRVRILGIDTPERGECGFSESGDRVRDLYLNREVLLILPEGTDDADKYDRMLRYVVRAEDNLDLGTALISEGLAEARYDSRDGYAWHPLEDRYRSLAATVEHPYC